MDITRSALILYTNEEIGTDGTFKSPSILVGVNQGEITTIGGRREGKETEQLCLIREVREETKEVLDYSNCPEVLSAAIIRKYNRCQYYFLKTSLKNLIRIREKFLVTTSDKAVSNELSSIEILDIEKLIEDLVVHKVNSYKPDFENMFLDIGFDTIVGRRINYMSNTIAAKVDQAVPTSRIPSMISVFPFPNDLPIIYGVILPYRLFITDQFYFQKDGKRLFRSGFLERKS